MEKSQKRRLDALFSDKRFLIALTVLLGATALLLYRTANREPVPATPPGLNPTLPAAEASEPSRSKLELQAETGGSRPDHLNLPGLDGGRDSVRLPASVPAQLNPYLYESSVYEPPSAFTGTLPSVRRSSLPSGGGSPDWSDADWAGEENPGTRRAPDPEVERQRTRLLGLLEAYHREQAARRVPAPGLARPEFLTPPAPVSALEGFETSVRTPNGFFGLASEARPPGEPSPPDSAIRGLRAFVAEDQLVTNGGRIRLQLQEPIRLRGVLIPAGTALYGLGEFGTERVRIRITGIRHQDQLLPVQLSVFDMDGIEGLYVPRVEAGPEVRQAVAGTVGGISLNPSVGTRNLAGTAVLSAAQAGASGLRSFLQRKATLSKAHLKGNYQVLLH